MRLMTQVGFGTRVNDIEVAPIPLMTQAPDEDMFSITNPPLVQSPTPIINFAIEEINKFDPMTQLANTPVRSNNTTTTNQAQEEVMPTPSEIHIVQISIPFIMSTVKIQQLSPKSIDKINDQLVDTMLIINEELLAAIPKITLPKTYFSTKQNHRSRTQIKMGPSENGTQIKTRDGDNERGNE